MPKTSFERVDVSNPEMAVFRISGQLGFHENRKVEQLTGECLKRDFKTVIFDLSDLSSLGGGVARIMREFVNVFSEKGGEARFVITKSVVMDFLCDGSTGIDVYPALEDAMEGTGAVKRSSGSDEASAGSGGDMTGEEETRAEGVADTGVDEAGREDQVETPDVILMAYDGEPSSGESKPEGRSEENAGRTSTDKEEARPASDKDDTGADALQGDPGELISEIFASASTKEEPEKPESTHARKNSGTGKSSDPVESKLEINKVLKKRILELKTLFSISSDFNGIKDRKKLIDIFLLTSIAQGGVEAAVFFEKKGKRYEPMIMKGLDSSAIAFFGLSSEIERRISGNPDVRQINVSPIQQEVASSLEEMGLEFLCPFNTSEGMAGIVFLGKRITGRGMQKEDFEFLRILINIARGAYENALILEREHERTLGIVKTLISLIEENTILKGTSEFVSRYVGMVAKNMDYPEESFKDLIYGTVLRDMGMIKVSDLIVRSPRELSRDEWNIINKHPEDGAEMLRRMKFGDHVVNIVLSHHERFNGEGYPRGLRGKEIPLGARIISVVESYSAMIHERPNRPALSEKEALDTLKENYGLRYDREVVRQFARIMEKEIARSVRPGVIIS